MLDLLSVPISRILPLFCPAEYAALKPKRRDGGGDLASRLHMSGADRDGTGDLATKLHMSKVGRADKGAAHAGADNKWQRLGDDVSCFTWSAHCL